MARRYHVSPLPPPGIAALPEPVAHHLARVMRARTGDAIVLFDGDGAECDATLTAVSGSGHRLAITLDVGPARPADREPEVRMHLAFAPPKGNRTEWLFEHGTEVGIAAFHPVATARLAGTTRSARWQRIVTAAAGQCDRGRIPTIHDGRPLADLLVDPTLPAERYVADLGAPPLGPARSAAAILLVGPEGGLTAAELAAAEDQGFRRCSLGITTLRAETAALAGAIRLLSGGGPPPDPVRGSDDAGRPRS